MITRDVKRLLGLLNDPTARALEGAAGFAVGRGHYEVGVEHLFAKLLEADGGDVPLVLGRSDVDPGGVGRAVAESLDAFKSGNTGRPQLSPSLLDLIERAVVIGAVHHGIDRVRGGTLLEALLESEAHAATPLRQSLSGLSAEALRERFGELVKGSTETRPASMQGSRPATGFTPGDGEGETALDLYTQNVTERARNGDIDPITGRDDEIRQAIDVLSRRRKNNPIFVGEAGVGKTAVVEGLALRVASGDLPDSLKDIEIVALDLGLLQAGAGVKGEFEARLKAVIDEVQNAPKPIVLFIDEAHTLVGAGGAAGTGDAANLLKPPLARGELRSLAATTWTEYKKHIEKDPALARRFQMIPVGEPSVDVATTMLRGIKTAYESHHGVHITDAAVRAAAELSDRYLSGRQLPDKAVDLLDTASARVKMSQAATPARLDAVSRRMADLDTEIATRRRDIDSAFVATDKVLAERQAERDALDAEHAELAAQWDEEKALAAELDAKRKALATGGAAPDAATVDAITELSDQLEALQGERPLVWAEVNERVVAEVIADWTGIPVGSMVKDEAAELLALESVMKERIQGQDEALDTLADAIRSSKSGLGKPDAPLGVFLLVGPSGVGKTETARALAEQMFGGERFLISINMSEYQEAHTVSGLKGSPPGYVGYGEGGVLTEAVRKRPYSVVLLDEVEKAHIDVMEMFYQVFDRGILRDGEGREVDFSNTIILATSNIGSDLIQQASFAEELPTGDELRALVHAPLANHFQPALLGRMRVVPYVSLDRQAMRNIARLKLSRIDRQLAATHGIRFVVPDAVLGRIAERCTEVDSGARNLDAILERSVLPEASRALLALLAENRDELPAALVLGLDEAGDFTYAFADTVPTEAELTAVETSAPHRALPEGEGTSADTADSSLDAATSGAAAAELDPSPETKSPLPEREPGEGSATPDPSAAAPPAGEPALEAVAAAADTAEEHAAGDGAAVDAEPSEAPGTDDTEPTA